MRGLVVTALLGLAALSGACRQDMHDNPRFEPLEASSLFKDGRSSRNRVPGTIARGERTWDAHLMEGRVNGEPATTFPFEVTRATLERGRQRFEIFCAPCHDRAGTGEGIIVARGLKQPPSLHVERLRQVAAGYLFDVISRGFGAMYDLSDRIVPADRWAIVAYVRTLQRSRNARLEDVPEAARARLLAEVPK